MTRKRLWEVLPGERVGAERPVVFVQQDEGAQGPDAGWLLVFETRRVLDKAGFCLWKCMALGGSVICVVRNTDLPEAMPFADPRRPQWEAMQRYPVYTERELNLLGESNADVWTQDMVLNLKRITPATVTKIEQARKTKNERPSSRARTAAPCD